MIIGVLASGGDGGTFLDWTINYLSGNDVFYTATIARGHDMIHDFKSVPLVDNPIIHNIGTAHYHSKMHPDQYSVDRCIMLLSSVAQPINSFFCGQSGKDKYLPQQDFVENLTNKYKAVKFIALYCTEENKHILLDRKIKTMGSYKEMISKGVDLTDDFREKAIIDLPNTDNRYMLNVGDMFYNLDKTIYDIFNYIGVEIKQDRFDKWKAIYNEWQTILPKSNSQ